ncbi:hypothetical protein OKR47_21310, partial [Clostridioides difficile]|nr:hypothetical protein [Clostridioides difficile]
ETLSNEKSSRVFDIFIKEYNLDSFEEAKKIILKLIKKYEITFVEDRLVEILYLIFDYPHKHYTFKHFEV